LRILVWRFSSASADICEDYRRINILKAACGSS